MRSARCRSAAPPDGRSFSPRFSTVSSIPGIDSRAPLRPTEQRILVVTEPLACPLLEPRERLSTWSRGRREARSAHVLDARLGRDREAGGHAIRA